MRISAKEVEIATGGEIISKTCQGMITEISTDTRKPCENSLFIPLTGINFDGHQYINQAFEKGSVISLTEKEVEIDDIYQDRVLIKVENTLKALGKLAAWYRLRFNPHVIAITGSTGKTTTKDMISLVLSQKYKVLKTQGNFNNEIGLPLTIFGLDETHEALILEMGMNMPGEISRLSKIARPDSAVITNIGLAHVERFGTKQNILKAKLEIMEGLSKNAIIYLNGDDTLLQGLMGLIDRQIVYYGIDEDLDVIATDIKINGSEGVEFEFQWKQRSYTVHLHVAGAHNVYNALAAVSVGLQHNISPEMIVKALGKYRPDRMRMNIMNVGGVKIINDVYNANPQSMQAAIDALTTMGEDGTRKFAVLGDMYELGASSRHYHCDVGFYAASKNIDYIIGVGEYASDIILGSSKYGVDKEKHLAFEKKELVVEYLVQKIRPGDVVLVKGSRGMAMESIVEEIESNFTSEVST